ARPGSDASSNSPDSGVSEQIQAHKKIDKQESLLHTGLSAIWDGGAGKSLAHLEKLQQEVNDARSKGDTGAVEALKQRCAEAVTADKAKLETRDTYLGYAGGAVEMAAMAVRPVGIAARALGILGTAGLYGLDSAKVGDSWQGQVADGVLGAGKGVALR